MLIYFCCLSVKAIITTPIIAVPDNELQPTWELDDVSGSDAFFNRS